MYIVLNVSGDGLNRTYKSKMHVTSRQEKQIRRKFANYFTEENRAKKHPLRFFVFTFLTVFGDGDLGQYFEPLHSGEILEGPVWFLDAQTDDDYDDYDDGNDNDGSVNTSDDDDDDNHTRKRQRVQSPSYCPFSPTYLPTTP